MHQVRTQHLHCILLRRFWLIKLNLIISDFGAECMDVSKVVCIQENRWTIYCWPVKITQIHLKITYNISPNASATSKIWFQNRLDAYKMQRNQRQPQKVQLHPVIIGEFIFNMIFNRMKLSREFFYSDLNTIKKWVNYHVPMRIIHWSWLNHCR